MKNNKETQWKLKLSKSNYFCFTLVVIFSIALKLSAQILPAGFSAVKVVTISDGTAMDFAPDGRLFICQKNGVVGVFKNGSLLPTPFITLTVDANGERGISGITFDPNFNSNHYVYIYYTATLPTIHNRLSRFTANGDVVLAGSEFPLLDAEAVTQIYHNGGGLGFGIDGKLYLAMGEDNNPNNAQDLSTYKGKLLRLNPDGTAPSDNPYNSSSSQITKRIWSSGLRNPYTLSIQLGTGRIFINNVGADTWEEINDATSPGLNFGWPIVEGFGTNPAYTNPVFAYPHVSTGLQGCAIVGGTFFNPVTTNYPAMYVGKYFYMDFCNGWMYYLTLGSPVSNTFFGSGLTTQNLALQVGPDGNLYYINMFDPGVYKIIYNNVNAPALSSPPSSLTVTAGQSATFNVSATGANPLSCRWQKNGIDISGATAFSYTINNVQPSDAGSYRAIVTNNFNSATSNAATLTVTAFNAPPQATINTPASPTFYHAGDAINFSGSGIDTEDGVLAASAFEWTVEFWHNNNHFHPGPGILPGISSGSFTIPNTGEASSIVFYRLKLKVTDSHGLIDTAHIDILPITSTITINTQPQGLQITFNSQPFTTPFSTLTVEGLLINMGVVSPQSNSGQGYAFNKWLDGGNAAKTITVGAGESTYTAVFDNTGLSCTASATISRDLWTNVTGTSVANIPVNTAPTSTSQLTIFEEPSNLTDNYGSRIRGYICPPVAGNYIFWIASDDNSELWLSTNNLPANKVKIASVTGYTSSRQWTKYPSQQSTPIRLIAGVNYYIEALHKEGTLGDNLAVGWQLPGGVFERPISGNRLSPFVTVGNTLPSVNITYPATNASFATPANITITANAADTDGNITKVEFFYGTIKLGEDLTSPYSFTWNAVATGAYALKAIATDNLGATTTSGIINVTITGCSFPIITPLGPTIMCSGSVTLQSNTGPGYIYQWKKDGVNITGATNSSYTATVSGGYQVKIIQGSCISWSAPTLVKIQSGLSASITPGGPTTFCLGGNVKLFANTCSGYTYQWKKDGAYIPGATGTTYTGTTAGNYQLQVTQAGLNAWSALVTVTVNACRESEINHQEESNPIQTISDSTNTFQMRVYPNPNTGFFTIVLNMAIAQDEKVKMRIVNIVGQEVYNKEYAIKDNYIKENVELPGSLPTGIYTLQVIVGNKVENTSMVLSR